MTALAPVTRDPAARRAILRLSLPMTLAGVTGVLVPLVVLTMIARMGSAELSVRALYMPLAFLFLAVQMGFDLSNQAAAARGQGRGAVTDVPAVALSMARVWVCAGVVLCAVLAAGAPGLAALLDVEAGVRDEFAAFVRWMAVANLTLAGPVLCASSLRGVGRARAAAAITLTNATVEIVGVALLGFGTGLGIMAVPVATAAAGAAGTTLGLLLLRRAGLWGTGPWRPEVIGQLRSIGLPVALSNVALFAGNLALLWVLSPFGPNVRAGFATAATLQGLVIIPGIALGSATAIVMNQQLGAGRRAWLPATMRAGLWAAVAAYAAIAVVCWAARGPLGDLMAGDPDVARETTRYFAVVAPTYLCLGPVLMALTTIEQIGGGAFALGLNACYLGGIVGVGGLLARTLTDPDALYWTAAVSNLGGGVAVVGAVGFVAHLTRRADP